MRRAEIWERTKKVISDVIVDTSVVLSEETYLVDELELSSMEIIEVVSELEAEFGVIIDEEKMNQFIQLKDVIDYLENECSKNE